MKIEALETALIESKLKHRTEIERLSMTLAEIESTEFNKIKPPKRTNMILEKINQGLLISNVREARDLIDELK